MSAERKVNRMCSKIEEIIDGSVEHGGGSRRGQGQGREMTEERRQKHIERMREMAGCCEQVRPSYIRTKALKFKSSAINFVLRRVRTATRVPTT